MENLQQLWESIKTGSNTIKETALYVNTELWTYILAQDHKVQLLIAIATILGITTISLAIRAKSKSGIKTQTMLYLAFLPVLLGVFYSVCHVAPFHEAISIIIFYVSLPLLKWILIFAAGVGSIFSGGSGNYNSNSSSGSGKTTVTVKNNYYRTGGSSYSSRSGEGSDIY